LARAQARITAMRPYAVKTQEVIAAVAGVPPASDEGQKEAALFASHPYLVVRPEKTVAILVLTSDRGLCGAFNSNINKAAERAWRERSAAGQDVRIYTIGRKGRDYLRRR